MNITFRVITLMGPFAVVTMQARRRLFSHQWPARLRRTTWFLSLAVLRCRGGDFDAAAFEADAHFERDDRRNDHSETERYRVDDKLFDGRERSQLRCGHDGVHGEADRQSYRG